MKRTWLANLVGAILILAILCTMAYGIIKFVAVTELGAMIALVICFCAIIFVSYGIGLDQHRE